MPEVTLERARKAKRAIQSQLEGCDTVTGIGITRADGEYAVKVNLIAPEPTREIPAEVDGVRVCVEITGPLRKR
jgi:hypothetical protein